MNGKIVFRREFHSGRTGLKRRVTDGIKITKERRDVTNLLSSVAKMVYINKKDAEITAVLKKI